MKLTNDLTGHVLNFPLPDRTGKSIITIDGIPILSATFRDSNMSVTTDDGRVFGTKQFCDYLFELIKDYAVN